MKDMTLNEDAFFAFHDAIKREGARIIRCQQISGGGGPKRFRIVYLVNQS